jgi:hypothetical protein
MTLSCRAVRELPAVVIVNLSSTCWCLRMCALYGTVCRTKNAGYRSLQQLKQAADGVAGGFESHESGHKSRGWDALAPHRRQGYRGHPFVHCDGHLSNVYDVVGLKCGFEMNCDAERHLHIVGAGAPTSGACRPAWRVNIQGCLFLLHTRFPSLIHTHWSVREATYDPRNLNDVPCSIHPCSRFVRAFQATNNRISNHGLHVH